jgi:hypothetical protein
MKSSNENIRRVQQASPQSSLLVSIPKSFSDRVNLHKGDYLICSSTKGKGLALVIRKLSQTHQQEEVMVGV